MANASEQTEIFNLPGQSSEFAELCNALYAEQLRELSQAEQSGTSQVNDIRLLRRRLASLSGHVQRTAHALLFAARELRRCGFEHELTLDIHAASWLAKQSQKPPRAPTINAQSKLASWLERNACLALVVPVLHCEQGVTQIYLDSIDEISLPESRVHFNQWGWFDISGNALASEEQGESLQLQLLKPDKAVMIAACCGHRWAASGRMQPMSLSLRTLLLTSTLVWPKFTEVRKLPF